MKDVKRCTKIVQLLVEVKTRMGKSAVKGNKKHNIYIVLVINNKKYGAIKLLLINMVEMQLNTL